MFMKCMEILVSQGGSSSARSFQPFDLARPRVAPPLSVQLVQLPVAMYMHQCLFICLSRYILLHHAHAVDKQPGLATMAPPSSLVWSLNLPSRLLMESL